MVQPYPNAPQMPPETAAPRPPVPDSVRHAVLAMYVGAAVGVIHAVIYFVTSSSTKAAYRRAHPLLSDHKVTVAAHVLVIAGAIGALIAAGLFIWMALKCNAGRNWARITGTVFFGIGVLSALGGLRNPVSPLDKIWSFVIVLAGLVAIILLWQRSSSEYFNAGKRPQA
jgi:uncharacterized membrane protein